MKTRLSGLLNMKEETQSKFWRCMLESVQLRARGQIGTTRAVTKFDVSEDGLIATSCRSKGKVTYVPISEYVLHPCGLHSASTGTGLDLSGADKTKTITMNCNICHARYLSPIFANLCYARCVLENHLRKIEMARRDIINSQNALNAKKE